MENRTKHYLQKLLVRKLAGRKYYTRIKFFKIYLKAKTGSDYEISRILLNILKSDDIFLDVGANLGQYIMRIKNKFYSGVKIYAFEPVISNYEILSKYIKNNCQNVLLENYAVSDTDGMDVLYIPLIDNIEVDTQASINYENRKMYYNDFIRQEIRKVTIDNYVITNNIQRIDYLKIDTEGNDERVIKGAWNSIAEFKPVIFCEDMENIETIEALSRLNYKRYLFTKDYKLSGFTDSISSEVFNDLIIFIPENREYIFEKYLTGRI
ncbi:MAG: FkbM family methyltransferase [Ignavibacteria bacterium]